MQRLSLSVCMLACLSLPLQAQTISREQIDKHADEYIRCKDSGSRLQLANRFFSSLLEAEYIDQPIQFPAGSHIDSVDVNVFYYIAEWHYGEGDYQKAIDYLKRATQCMGEVDDMSRSDVYALLGAAYFRLSEYDKATEALNQSYLLDKKSGDFDRLSSTLNSIASVFTAAGKPQEAEKYIKEAIAANSLTDNLRRRAVLYGTLSELYHSTDHADEALEYAQKALDTERHLGDSARIGVRLSQLAGAQMKLSKFSEASRSLQEAIPLLYRSKNYHSWAICQNQMGDILSSEGKDEEAAQRYLEAAMLFLKQGDKYNEMHAREGLYRTTKASNPDEAMMHLERAKLLQDSIYQTETAEAISRYNAIYFNDILEKENEQAEHQRHILLLTFAAFFIVLLAIIGLAAVVTWRRHKRRVQDYEQNIHSLQEQYAAIRLQYQKMVQDIVVEESDGMTDDSVQFLQQLTSVISATTERGISDVDSIAREMEITTSALRRRLLLTLNVTPKAYILQVRMNKARYLLQHSDNISVSEVADRCGYAQVPNFTRAFKNYYGVMPSEMKGMKNEE